MINSILNLCESITQRANEPMEVLFGRDQELNVLLGKLEVGMWACLVREPNNGSISYSSANLTPVVDIVVSFVCRTKSVEPRALDSVQSNAKSLALCRSFLEDLIGTGRFGRNLSGRLSLVTPKTFDASVTGWTVTVSASYSDLPCI